MRKERIKVLFAGVMVGVGIVGMVFGESASKSAMANLIHGENNQVVDCKKMQEMMDSGTYSPEEKLVFEKSCAELLL